MIKRALIISLFIAVFSLAFGASSSPRGAGNSGYLSGLSLSAPPTLQIKYQYAGYTDTLPSNVIAYDDKILVARDMKIYALSAETGKYIWIADLNANLIQNSIHLVNDKIIAATERSVHAFDLSTGEQIWQYTPTTKISGMQYDKNYIYVLSNKIDFISIENGVSQGNNAINNTATSVGPILRDNGVIVSGQNGSIIRIENGAMRWSVTLDKKPIKIEPIANDSTMYVEVDGTIYAINPRVTNNSIKWKITRDDIVSGTMSANNNYLVFATTSNSLVKVNSDGKYIGSEAGTEYFARAAAAPIILSNCTFFTMEYGNMAAINNSGTLIWSYRFPSNNGDVKIGQISFDAEANMYAASSDGIIYKFAPGSLDTTPPFIVDAFPSLQHRLYSNDLTLKYVGASIVDEGIGLNRNSIKFTVDGQELSNPLRYDAKTGYYYAAVEGGSLGIGKHTFKIAASDAKGNSIDYSTVFYIGNNNTAEIVQVIVRDDKLLPSFVIVKAGTVVEWINETDSEITVNMSGVGEMKIPPYGQEAFIVPGNDAAGKVYDYKINNRLSGSIRIATDAESRSPLFPAVNASSLPKFNIPPFLL